MADVFSEQSRDTGVPETGRQADAAGSRALVPLTLPPAERAGLHAVRHDARFVAQLIATATRVPQTRRLCRAEPDDAATTYTGAARGDAPAAANGLALSLVA